MVIEDDIINDKSRIKSRKKIINRRLVNERMSDINKISINSVFNFKNMLRTDNIVINKCNKLILDL